MTAPKLPATSAMTRAVTAVAIALVLAIAWQLRVISINETRIEIPLRADAFEYYSYASNLKYFGVYSRQPVATTQASGIMPAPDAERMPGYALFLLGNVVHPPDDKNLRAIYLRQSACDLVSIVLVFFLARLLMPVALAVIAALLTALSPHLISMTTYVLTETLFTTAVTACALLGALSLRQPFSPEKLSPPILCSKTENR